MSPIPLITIAPFDSSPYPLVATLSSLSLHSQYSSTIDQMSIPSQQKTLLLESKFGQFTVRETETPKPGPEEVLIRIMATALNPLDWKVQAFAYFVEKYPAILGFDAAGTIAQLGENVPTSHFAVGDRV